MNTKLRSTVCNANTAHILLKHGQIRRYTAKIRHVYDRKDAVCASYTAVYGPYTVTVFNHLGCVTYHSAEKIFFDFLT